MTRLRILGSLALGLSFALPAASAAAPPVSGARFFHFFASAEPEVGPSQHINFTLHRDGLSVHDISESDERFGRRIVRSMAPPGALAAFRRALTDNQIGRQASCRLEEAVPLGGRISYSFSWIRADGQRLSFTASSGFLIQPCPSSVSRLIGASLAFVRAQETRSDAVRVDFPDPANLTEPDSILASAGSNRRLLVRATHSASNDLTETGESVGAYIFRDGLVVATKSFGDNRFFSTDYTRGQVTRTEMADLTRSLAAGRVGQLTDCKLFFVFDEVHDRYAWAGEGTRTNQFHASTESTEADCPSAVDSLNLSIRRIEARVRSHADSWVITYSGGE